MTVNSVKNIKRYLSSILSEAVDDELISENPALNLRKLIKRQEQEAEINALSWEEKALFEDAIQKHFPRYYPLFLTALRTGLRVGGADSSSTRRP